MRKKVVVVGAGAGGLAATRSLARADVDITLIDKTNHHLFQPLLYQVAVAALSPGDVAAPVREILRKQKNVKVVMGEVIRFDTSSRQVTLANGNVCDYDYLIVAAGIKTCYYGNDCWEKVAPGVKTLDDALYIREKILRSFEEAEIAPEGSDTSGLMTFVVVGGGPTGIETVGALAELTRKAMLRDFKRIDPSATSIILIEALDRILCGFRPELSRKAQQYLEKLGVEVMLKTRITGIDEKGICIGEQFIPSSNVIWTAGTMASDVISTLQARSHISGRVYVNRDCTIEGHPEVFVIGDVSVFLQNEKPLPDLGPVATQQAKYAARIIREEIEPGKRPVFKYKDKGNVAVVGRAKAVMQIGRLNITGFFAWMAWVTVHILVMADFRSRFKVMAEWQWHYLGKRHGIRLITGRYRRGAD